MGVVIEVVSFLQLVMNMTIIEITDKNNLIAIEIIPLNI